MGFSIGVGPVLGFRYGAQDKRELRRLYRMVMAFVAASSLVIVAFSMLMVDPLLHVFTKDAQTLAFTVASLLILPSVLGVAGVWLAVPCAELLTVVLCICFHCRYFKADGVYFGA